ncbi:MAG: 50S ribosomal protein L23 [bacterium]
MELSIYDVIKRSITTPKSIDLHKRLGQLTFEVNKKANKIMVKQAVEKIWDVKVDKVRILNIQGKTKEFARKSFKSPGLKKAIVTLKKGQTVELPSHFETMGVSGGKSESSEVK